MLGATSSRAGDTAIGLCVEPALETEFLLPVLTRSVVLLKLLLQNEAIDLELASSIVALDPGLAFAVLQLANLERDTRESPIWQIPSALVAAGQEALETLLDHAPRLESPTGRLKDRLSALAQKSVMRACVAHWLARELRGCDARQSFLCGLLLSVPRMVALVHARCPDYRAGLMAAMARSLPAVLVRASLAGRHAAGEGSKRPLATSLIAEALLGREQSAGGAAAAAVEAWNCWPEVDGNGRHALLESGSEMACWARANWLRLEPWELMSRLERRRPWE